MDTIGKFAERVGVHTSTLRRWEREGKLIPDRTMGGQRRYTEQHYAKAMSLLSNPVPQNSRIVVYCRVSSNNQKNDLQSQKQAMEQFTLSRGIAVTDWVEEVGGGLNFKRPKFLQIVKWAIQGEIKELHIAHKDRLCRFGFDLVEQIINWGNGLIIVANAESLSPQEELVQDLLAIVHCFSSRLYGLRKYKGKVKKLIETGELD